MIRGITIRVTYELCVGVTIVLCYMSLALKVRGWQVTSSIDPNLGRREQSSVSRKGEMLPPAACRQSMFSSRAKLISIPCSIPVASIAARVAASGRVMRMVINVPPPSASKVVSA